MRETAGVYSESDAPLPPHLDGIPRVYSTGDVGHLIGSSQRWVGELIARGDLKPTRVWVKFRHGRWEPTHFFEAAEVERYMRNRGAPRRTSREPRQLRLQLYTIRDGGKA